MERGLEKDEERRMRGKRLAKIHKRSCTADKEAATAMTSLFHFRGATHGYRLPVKGVRPGPSSQGKLSTDHCQWLKGCSSVFPLVLNAKYLRCWILIVQGDDPTGLVAGR